MTPSELVLAQGFFWSGFGGCLLALLAYDFANLFLDWLLDVLPVAFLWVVTKWGKRP